MRRTHKIFVAAAALALVGAGAAFADARLGAPREESNAIIEDAADQLGVEPSELRSALKRALANRIDAAVEEGELSEEQGERLKERVTSDDVPLLLAPPLGLGLRGLRRPHIVPAFGPLAAAAEYLELSPDELRAQLGEDKTLAELAQERGKSVDGLVDALVAHAKEQLDRAVEDGRLSEEREQAILEHLEARMEDLVNGRHHPRFRFRFRGEPFGERVPFGPRGV